MNDVLVALELERLKYLDGKSTDQPSGHSLKVVLLDEFIKIHAEQFEG